MTRNKRILNDLNEASRLYQGGDPAGAARIMGKLLAREPNFAEGHADHGVMLAAAGRLGDAVAACRRAIALQPGLGAAHLQLAAALLALNRPDEALAPARRAAILAPNQLEPAFHLATALFLTGDFTAAAAAFRRAADIDPGNARIRNNIGLALKEAGRLDESAAAFREAIDRDDTLADAWNNLGTVLQAQGAATEAGACYDRALARQPGTPLYAANTLVAALYRDDIDLTELARRHLTFGRTFGRALPRPAAADHGDDRLKIGFVSSDFRDHPVAINLLPGLRHHDRTRIALHFYSATVKTDAVTESLRALADGWREIGTLDDGGAAAAIRADGIDILVFLAGRFDHNRPTLAECRAAPIQISLHDPATSGLTAMDYIIGDPVLLPRLGTEFFSERPLRLPHFYLADPPHDLPAISQTRNGPPVFGCFNNPAKIGPRVLGLWGRILAALPESRLVLKFLDRYAVPSIRRRILETLVAAGAKPGQIEFLTGWEERGALLERYNGIDVALDTLPFSGSTTTFQALCMGVPVVTRPLDRMVSRWSAALLAPLALDELIADSDDSYVAIAIRMAGEAPQWRGRRHEISARLAASPFCDGARWARHMERLYRAVWRRHRRDRDGRPTLAEARQPLIEGRYRDAVAAYRRIVTRAPDSVEAQANLGTALKGLGLHRLAAAAYGRAVVLAPDNAEILTNLGELLTVLKRPEEAEAACARAVALAPGLAEAHYNRGNALRFLDRYPDAEAAYTRALALRPTFADALVNRGSVLAWLGRHDEALADYRRALELAPDRAETHHDLGNLLIAIGRPDEAAVHYQAALECRPDLIAPARGVLMAAAYRDDLDQEAWAEIHRAFGRRFDRDNGGNAFANSPDSERPLRIGLLSSDFRGHPVAVNLLPVLRRHDRRRISLFFYAQVGKADDITDQCKALADGWRDIADLDDEALARRIREDGIDILVLLAGRFDENRPQVAARRAAPVQISLHDVATSGLKDMDYIIGDSRLIPRRTTEFFTERPLRLPHFAIADFPADLPEIEDVRADAPPVFGSFNNPAKMTPRVLALWGRILKALPESRLVLKFQRLYANDTVSRRIRDGIVAGGGQAHQIAFLSEADSAATFIRRYNGIDVALDTFPFSGSTTTFQALCMGVPVVTRPLDRMVSRWSASMLHTLGLDELIADSDDSYVDIAVRAATNAADWRARRREISARLAASPHCAPARWARHIERLYRAVWRRHCRRIAARTESERMAAAAMHAHGRGRPEEAAALLRKALRLSPDYAEAQCALGATLAGLGRLDEAIAAYDKAVSLKPDFAVAWSNLGVARQTLGQMDEAVVAYDRAIAADPANAAALTNLGLVLTELGRTDEALAACSRAIALAPGQAEAWSNLGLALRMAGRTDEALAARRRAVAIDPNNAKGHRNLAMSLLLNGEYREGFAEFEWRRALGDCPPPDSTRPEWRGEPVAGRTLLLYGEQGLGDVIQFARYATPLAESGARVILAVPRPLARLLATIPGVAGIADRTPLPDHDWHFPLLSLPHRLGTTVESVPAACPYVAADPAAKAAWRKRLDALPGRKVGLVWSGDPRPHDVACALVDRRRSLTLAQLAPLAAVPGITLVSLQKGAPAGQARTPPPGMDLIDWMDEIDDFADTAALADALDLVITVDTSVAHLAGALAKPVWILSRFDGCWRWLLERADSPWYPTARLFRQPAPGDWSPAIAELVRALTFWIES